MKRLHPQGNDRGFTLIEILVVIIIIGILAAIAIPVFLNQRKKATDTRIQTDIRNVHNLVVAYGVEHGTYPSTGSLNTVWASPHCTNASTHRADWVPELGETLPVPPTRTGGNGLTGCYMYASDGTNYVLTAWNMRQSDSPNTTTMYRRLGFREPAFTNENMFYCNHVNIGHGGNPSLGAYNAQRDYYKRSYTFSNITTCDETPPAPAA